MRVEPFIKSNHGQTGPSREDGGGPYGITYLVLRIFERIWIILGKQQRPAHVQ